LANTKDKLIAVAQKLVEKGQFDKAIKEYLKVVATDDKDVRIWLKIGDLYAKLGKKPEAAETYQKVAEFYSDQGFYLKSVAVYKQILKIDPRLVEVNQRLAELYKQLGLLSDAMQQYETVAAFFHKDGRTREALAALKQIVELDPETVANRIKLAELYSKEQMVREAIDEFAKAAEQLKESGRFDDYMKVAERLLFHSPDNRPVSKELARLYIEKGDPRRALPKLQVCFKADARDIDVLGLLARAFEALDQRAKSVSVLKEQARILGENGDRAGRDDVYRKILKLAPGDADAEAALAGAGGGSSKRNVVAGAPPQVPLSASWPPKPAQPGLTGSQPLIKDDRPPADEFDDEPPRAPVPAPGSTSVGNLLDATGTQPKLDGAPLDSEAVAKILNETDVYIKYKLYTKAIEHVQRVFEVEPKHIEAREKLKALYLTVGKREEAVLELWSLAEQAELNRKRRYLREILELDPSNERAANQLGTDVGFKADELDGAPPEAAASTLDAIDEDAIEELAEDEFDVADPSSRIALDPLADESGGENDGGSSPSGRRYVEEPHHAAGGDGASTDDDLIPLVVEPVAEAPAPEQPLVIEDRFGFGDDPEIADESDVRADAVPPTDSEAHAVSAGIEALASGGVDAESRMTMDGEATAHGEPPGAGLEDDLDEADFFVQQSLFDEARDILRGLLERYPGHPLVTAKLRDVDAMERAAVGPPTAEAPLPAPSSSPSNVPTLEQPAMQADLAAEPPDELPGANDADATSQAAGDPAGDPVYEVTRRGVIEKGVTAEDFETHYDLGIAYKEMGLLDDAVAEFKLVMKDPAREVQCHLMIGLCCLEKGLQTEAIGHFKKGLYVEGITERESLSLYFELGQAYERLGDPREALYYYEKVLKRDARFRNVERIVENLRGGGTVQAPAPGAPEGGELDAAFDSLLDGDQR
jgi:tetratricopeptide (TPR) repeat protein